MSGAYLTVNGAYNAVNGLVTIAASNFTGNAGGALNVQLQSYLTGLSSSLNGGNFGFVNNDVVAGTAASVTSSAAGTFYEVTNFDSTGAVNTAAANVSSLSIPGAVTDLAVQAPGSETLYAGGNVTSALFSAASNVDYNLFNGAGSVYLAGGNDSVDVSSAVPTSLTFFSAGNDTIDLNGIGSPTVGGVNVYSDGSATTAIYVGGSEYATVTASDNAQAAIVFVPGAGENIDYINNSTAEQIIFSSAHNIGGVATYSNNAITAFGGAGGLFAVGGHAGANSLTGGTGLVTLVGGGANDVLTANGFANSGNGNVLFNGNGSFETLLASASTGNNLFAVGFTDVGVGNVTAFGDVVSTQGSGAQVFFVGNDVGSSIFGSTVTGATNAYYVISDTLTGSNNGGQNNNSTYIYNFSANSHVNLTNAGLGTSLATVASSIDSVRGGVTSAVVGLSDGTTLIFKGVSESHLNFGSGSSIVYTVSGGGTV
jgi:hypothetical protein